MRYFFNAYEGNWKQLIITTDDRLNQAKPPERGEWVCFVPPRAWKTASKNILSRTQNQDNWLLGYITEITDVTNRECNVPVQGHTDKTTLSMILAPDTAWEYKPDLVTLPVFHIRNDRMRNQQNIHNTTYLNLPPTAKKPHQLEIYNQISPHKNRTKLTGQ